MYKNKFILEECRVDENYYPSMGNNTEKIIALERFDNLIFGAKSLDKDDMFITINNKIHFSSKHYDNEIAFHFKLKNNEIQQKYPKVKFKNIKKRNFDYFNAGSFHTAGKRFSYLIVGKREYIAQYFWLEHEMTITEFNKKYPKKETLAKAEKTYNVSISCKKENSEYLRTFFSNLNKDYLSLNAEILENKSRTEKSFVVNLFRQPCKFNIVLKGMKVELDFLIDLLAEEKEKYQLIE